ncbi:MAG: cell division protein PerM [Pseudonocardiaceae bacterium]
MSLLLSPVSGAPAADVAGRVSLSRGTAVGAALLLAVAGYLVSVALFASLTAASSADISVASVTRAGAAVWLAAHQVPLTIDGTPLSVLPLLPTLLLGVLVACGAAWIADRGGLHTPADAGWVAGVIAGTHGVLGAVVALALTPAAITVDPGLAAVGCTLVAGAAAGLGLARRCGLLPEALRRAPGWVRPGLTAGGWGLVVLLTAGLAVVLVGLVASAAEVSQMSGAGAGSVVGLTVVSLGYLPNAAIAGLSWLAGPGFSIGMWSASPVTMQAGPLPAVPLLAALPQGPVQPWWGIALAVPLLVGVGVGRRCGTAAPDLVGRLRVLAVAATTLALGSAVLAGLAGGRLGAAAFDPVRVPAGALAVAVLGATLLGGCAATILSSLPSNDAGPAPATPDIVDLTDRDGNSE